jgi:hypothetical protein
MDKVSPPTKKIPRGDGVKQGSANKTLTTPNQNTDGKYVGGGATGKSIFR